MGNLEDREARSVPNTERGRELSSIRDQYSIGVIQLSLLIFEP